MLPVKFGVKLPRKDKAMRMTHASFSTAADFTHLCLTCGNKATTAITHHAWAMLQMHECELKNSQPAILSPRCSPIIFSVNVIKEKAGSLPRDWLEPCSSFVRPSNSVLRWGRQRKSVCVCCQARNRQLTFNGISGSRCIWENLIKRMNSCCFLSAKHNAESTNAKAWHESCRFLLISFFCPGPPPPLFTFSFNKSLEDRCAPLIGHLHL